MFISIHQKFIIYIWIKILENQNPGALGRRISKRVVLILIKKRVMAYIFKSISPITVIWERPGDNMASVKRAVNLNDFGSSLPKKRKTLGPNGM